MTYQEIQNNSHKPRVVVVGCLHGNELIGKHIFDAIVKNPSRFPNIAILLANTEAIAANSRYIDQDLNRSFPGNITGNKEQRLAAKILKLVKDADYLIDFHTTTSPEFEVAAITDTLNPATRRIIQAFKINRVAIMEKKLLSTSLIGNIENGISIEYGLNKAANPITIKNIIDALTVLNQDVDLSPFTTEVFDVASTIPKTTTTVKKLQNFIQSDELGGLPFIIDEKHYKDIRGFLLKNRRIEKLV